MPRIISSHWVTADGFIAGPNGELDFVRGDQQLAEYEINIISSVKHLLFGRTTYDELSGYWGQVPNRPDAAEWEKIYASKMNPLPKTVLSHQLKEASWQNSQIVRHIDKIGELKATAEGDILIYGSASVIQELTQRELIDEYQLLVHPILLGSGKRLFGESNYRLTLAKSRHEKFESGITLDVYQRA